jgi:hypothetical protein
VPARYLPIYLNDHLAGATAGVELAKRTLAENEGSDLGSFLRELRDELVEDRNSLLSLMHDLGVAPSPGKVAAGWLAEKVGRLKLNGEVRDYSPLSRLVELEGLAAGIESKRTMWLALLEIRDLDERLHEARLEELAERARSQRERLEPHRLAAARVAFG